VATPGPLTVTVVPPVVVHDSTGAVPRR
jgi:hypothetical protein